MKIRGLSFEQIVSKHKKTYRTLSTQGLWSPALTNKKQDGLAAMRAEFSKLKQQLSQQHRNKPNKNTTESEELVNCWRCGAKGHHSQHCTAPHPKTTQPTTNQPPKKRNWKRVPPTNNTEDKKTVDGVEWTWCGTCRRWCAGPRAHKTSEHVKKKSSEPSEAQTTENAKILEVDDPKGDVDPFLFTEYNFLGGLLMGEVVGTSHQNVEVLDLSCDHETEGSHGRVKSDGEKSFSRSGDFGENCEEYFVSKDDYQLNRTVLLTDFETSEYLWIFRFSDFWIGAVTRRVFSGSFSFSVFCALTRIFEIFLDVC